MRSASLALPSCLLLLVAGACSSGSGGGGTVQLDARSFQGTSWTLQSVEGAPVPVSGTWQFAPTGTYTWTFHAPPDFDNVTGTGTYTFDGTTLTVTGIARDMLVSSGRIAVSARQGEFSFADDDGSRWVYRGQFASTRGGGGNEGSCVAVQQGPWRFTLSAQGLVLLEFTDGDLQQSGCTVSYDVDSVLRGTLAGSRWTGSAPQVDVEFSGDFRGSPPRQFSGTWRTSAGASGTMAGVYVGGM